MKWLLQGLYIYFEKPSPVSFALRKAPCSEVLLHKIKVHNVTEGHECSSWQSTWVVVVSKLEAQV